MQQSVWVLWPVTRNGRHWIYMYNWMCMLLRQCSVINDSQVWQTVDRLKSTHHGRMHMSYFVLSRLPQSNQRSWDSWYRWDCIAGVTTPVACLLDCTHTGELSGRVVAYWLPTYGPGSKRRANVGIIFLYQVHLTVQYLAVQSEHTSTKLYRTKDGKRIDSFI